MFSLAKIRGLHCTLVKYFSNSFLVVVPYASIPRIVVLSVNVSVNSARPWELTLTTHAQNTVPMLVHMLITLYTGKAILTVIDNYLNQWFPHLRKTSKIA